MQDKTQTTLTRDEKLAFLDFQIANTKSQIDAEHNLVLPSLSSYTVLRTLEHQLKNLEEQRERI